MLPKTTTTMRWERGDGNRIIAYLVFIHSGIHQDGTPWQSEGKRRAYTSQQMLMRFQHGGDTPDWYSPPDTAPQPDDFDPLEALGRELEGLWPPVATEDAQEDHAESTTPTEQQAQSETRIAADIELVRLCIALKQAPLVRLWLILVQTVRESGGKDYVFRDALPALLCTYGVKFSDSNLNRWLRQGNGLYWNLTRNGRVRLVGYETLSTQQIEYSLNFTDKDGKNPLSKLVSTNSPGQRRSMYIDVASHNLMEFEVEAYLAWYKSKNDTTIARSTISTLWNRDLRVLREWERVAGTRLKIVSNFSNYTVDFSNAVPQDEYGELRPDVREYSVAGATRWQAQMSNTYIVTATIRQHDKRGQSRRVSGVVRKILVSDKPAGNSGQDAADSSTASGGLESTGRQYFDNRERVRSRAKHTGVKSRFVALGWDGDNRVQWEYSPDGRERIAFRDCANRDKKGHGYA